MPSATRNTKTNNGIEVSAAAKPNTCLKNSEEIPSAEPKDSTTVAMSTSGATIARSSRPRMMSTTPRISGMSRFLSCAAALSTSLLMAVPPPTFASAPWMACTVVRILSTSVYAPWLSGDDVIVACRKALPSLVAGGVTDAMPGVPASAALTSPALDAVEITSTGSPEPAGKYLASTFCAVIDDGVPRNDWATVSGPNLNPIRPAVP